MLFRSRTFNCLRQNVVITFLDLTNWPDQELLRMPNFGRKCLADLMTSLEEYETKSIKHDVYIWVNDNIGLVKTIMDASIHEPVLLLPFKGGSR